MPTHLRRLHLVNGGIRNGDKKRIESAAAGHGALASWIVPKNAAVGDDVIINVVGEGLFAKARLASLPMRPKDGSNRYRADLRSVTLIRPVIGLAELKRLCPRLKWARYPRSITTPRETISARLLSLIERATRGNYNRKNGTQNTDGGTRFWVVSPNVRNNNDTVAEWRKASVRFEGAFMGYKPADRQHKQIGYKFARVVKDGDIILIARRFKGSVEVVGLGRVSGKSETEIPGFIPSQPFGSLRRLAPFKVLSRCPKGLPLLSVLWHTTALREIVPAKSRQLAEICAWMERTLNENGRRRRGRKSVSDDGFVSVRMVKLFNDYQLEYEVRSRQEVIVAKKLEADLLRKYTRWLAMQGRKLVTGLYDRLRCDAYEPETRNLIEAKASGTRGYIRMAVGQLFDYAHQGRRTLGKPNMAILLPSEPADQIQIWLKELGIAVVWRESGKFLDNANGQFS